MLRAALAAAARSVTRQRAAAAGCAASLAYTGHRGATSGRAATAAAICAAAAASLALSPPAHAAAAVTPPSSPERSFIMIKPDGVQRGLIADIIGRFERKGYKLVAAKVIVPTAALASAHYAEHEGKPFFPKLVAFLTSGPVVAMVWEGQGVIVGGRTLIGATNPSASSPGTIRGDLAVDTGRNVVHGSDSAASAAREAGLWFAGEGEITEWARASEAWVYE